ncbi:cytidine deaminase [Phyllobacterium chamaecytisi]|uniref:cytidine deaminase n=1 Tax=Phyllobacterium chamaecytisi TaxID=2876082 RepID=UPI001CCA9367|nr:cytidine deaminase [Phyllobacterium sp. KW56]
MSQDLFEAARNAMKNHYSPYSDFPSGAAIRGEDGKIYAGCNIEVASYPEGWCAETTAIGCMIVGGARKILEVAVIAERTDDFTPCGGCRQRLAEFADHDTPVHLCDRNGIVKTVTMTDLMPFAFGGEALADR